MAQFKVGDRVRIRSWESMEMEFGLAATGSIDCMFRFTKGMKHLCGREATINRIVGEQVYLSGWSNADGDVRCSYSTDMIELSSRPSIHITTDGKTTHAVLKDGGKVSKRAKAVCSPHDEFDFETGARIAFDRLCTSLAENSAFKGIREVKRPAKVGEWVKFIKDHGGYLTPGSIHRVESELDGTLFFLGGFVEYECSDHDKYVVLEGYTPEPEKPKYYTGKVVCVECGCFHTVGKVYEVKDGVLFDDSSTPYDGVRVESLEQLNADVAPKFIEFKGEA